MVKAIKAVQAGSMAAKSSQTIKASKGLKFDLQFFAKRVNLPSWKKIKIDLEHILSGHTPEGVRAIQSQMAGKGKDVFKGMSDKQIEKAIRYAYRDSKLIKIQGDRAFLRGTYKNLTSLIKYQK